MNFDIYFGNEYTNYGVSYNLKKGIYIDSLIEQLEFLRKEYKGKKLWLKPTGIIDLESED